SSPPGSTPKSAGPGALDYSPGQSTYLSRGCQPLVEAIFWIGALDIVGRCWSPRPTPFAPAITGLPCRAVRSVGMEYQAGHSSDSVKSDLPAFITANRGFAGCRSK